MSNQYGPRIVTDGLVFNMDFSNPKCYSGTGSYCYDLSGNNFQGELVGPPTYTTNGTNKFFAFAGNSYIKIPNSTLLDSQTISIEVWFKTNSISQNGFWFEKGTVNTQYSLFQEGSYIRLRHNHSGTSYNTSVSSISYLNNTDWFHIVGTLGDFRRVYINARLRDIADISSYNISTNSGGMSIGAYGGYSASTGRGYNYNGNIAVVKVYNRELSQDEVTQNYNALKGRFGL